jgi:voltage-gated potassium channel
MADDARETTFRSIPLFAELSDEALQRVISIASESTVPAGQVLIEARREGSGLFVIEEGTVVVETPGKEIELGAGDFVGEMALLTGEQRSARVQARTEVRLLAISRIEFDRLLDEEPSIAIPMLRTVARRLAAMET